MVGVSTLRPCNLQVPGSHPSPHCYLDLSSVVSSSIFSCTCSFQTCVRSAFHQLRFLIVYVLFVIFGYLFTVSPISTTVLKHTRHLYKMYFFLNAAHWINHKSVERTNLFTEKTLCYQLDKHVHVFGVQHYPAVERLNIWYMLCNYLKIWVKFMTAFFCFAIGTM